MTGSPGADAYSVAATVFILMPKTPKNAAHSKSALAFFQWALENGQKSATVLDYVPVPPALVTQIEAYWKSAFAGMN
jgi:phosphate transport system substrate-binding protein